MAAEESIFPEVDTGPVSSETLSDAELIAATRVGDAGAFAVLYTRHVDAARACARRLVRSRSEADDLVAEGFAKVLGALRKGKGPDLAFRPYLLTAVRNALYDRTRRDSRIDFTDETPEPVNAVLLSADYDREDKAMVAQAYAALPERWQMVLWHADVEGRSPAEIAPLLGISANSVAALAYRAREGLRQAYLAAHVNRGVNDQCRATTEKLSAYVRDGLSARDRRTVQEHLDGCTSCTALLAELQEANRSLKVVLLPVLAGVTASAYLGGLSGGGVTRLFRRNPTATAAGAVAAAAAVAFAAIALASPSGKEEAQALTVPPIGSGRPTTTTSTSTTTTPPETTAGSTTTTSSTLPIFTPPTFDTAVPPNTYVPYNPYATTVTTVRRYTTTTRPRYTTTTRPRYTTTTTSSTTSSSPPPETATTTTTIAPTTTTPATVPPAAPALTSAVTGLGPVYSGQSAYFSVRVANAASGNAGSARKVAVGPAEGVTVTFNLPAGAAFLGASSPDWQCEVTGSSVRCLLPRLNAGAATEAIFTLDVPENAAGSFAISPTVMLNGKRIDAKPTTRPIADGSKIFDFGLVRGGVLEVTGNSVSMCEPEPDLSADQCALPRTPVNVLGGDFTNSSSAELNLQGRPVQQAFLVWQGQTNPTAPVVLVGPNGSQRSITNARPDPGAGSFAAVADITDVVKLLGGGTYSVANVPTGSGQNDFGGWAIVAVTDDGSGVLRGLTVGVPRFDVPVFSANPLPAIPVGVAGLAPTAKARNVSVAVLAGEGDRQGGDDLTTNERLLVNDLQALTSSRHPDGDVFRSSVVGLVDDPVTYGTDLEKFVTTVPGNASEIKLQATKQQDGVIISAVALLYDL